MSNVMGLLAGLLGLGLLYALSKKISRSKIESEENLEKNQSKHGNFDGKVPQELKDMYKRLVNQIALYVGSNYPCASWSFYNDRSKEYIVWDNQYTIMVYVPDMPVERITLYKKDLLKSVVVKSKAKVQTNYVEHPESIFYDWLEKHDFESKEVDMTEAIIPFKELPEHMSCDELINFLMLEGSYQSAEVVNDGIIVRRINRGSNKPEDKKPCIHNVAPSTDKAPSKESENFIANPEAIFYDWFSMILPQLKKMEINDIEIIIPFEKLPNGMDAKEVIDFIMLDGAYQSAVVTKNGIKLEVEDYAVDQKH